VDDLPRDVRAFLFADLEGSTRLLRRIGARAVRPASPAWSRWSSWSCWSRWCSAASGV